MVLQEKWLKTTFYLNGWLRNVKTPSSFSTKKNLHKNNILVLVLYHNSSIKSHADFLIPGHLLHTVLTEIPTVTELLQTHEDTKKIKSSLFQKDLEYLTWWIYCIQLVSAILNGRKAVQMQPILPHHFSILKFAFSVYFNIVFNWLI